MYFNRGKDVIIKQNIRNSNFIKLNNGYTHKVLELLDRFGDLLQSILKPTAYQAGMLAGHYTNPESFNSYQNNLNLSIINLFNLLF